MSDIDLQVPLGCKPPTKYRMKRSSFWIGFKGGLVLNQTPHIHIPQVSELKRMCLFAFYSKKPSKNKSLAIFNDFFSEELKSFLGFFH